MDEKWALGGMSKTDPKPDQPAPAAPVAAEPVVDATPTPPAPPEQQTSQPALPAPPPEPVVAAVAVPEPVTAAPPATKPIIAEPAPTGKTSPQPAAPITPPKPVATEPLPTPEPATPTPPAAAPRRSRLGTALTSLVGILALAAIGTSAWVYSETQRDVARLSTDIAQFRLSLELFNRQQSAAPASLTALPAIAPADASQLQSLAERLTALEQASQSQPAPVPAAALPPTPEATTGGSANAADCLPPGTRLLVAAGDSYPICGVEGAAVTIGSVSNGFLVLQDGPTIAAGATIKLPGTPCTIGVMSSGDGGVSGYAEIRVTC